jgi:hypothetical protein
MGKQQQIVETPESRYKAWLHDLVSKVMAPYNPDPSIQRHIVGFPGLLCQTADYYVNLIWDQVAHSDPQPLVNIDMSNYETATANIEAVFAMLMAPYKPTPHSKDGDYPTVTTLRNMVIAEYIDKIMGYRGWRIGKLHHTYPKLHLKTEKWIPLDDQYYADMIAALPEPELKDLKKRLDQWITDFKDTKYRDKYYEDIPEDQIQEYKGVRYTKGSVCGQIVTWSMQTEALIKAK